MILYCARLIHAIDYDGRICGLDSAVKHLPNAYYMPSTLAGINFLYLHAYHTDPNTDSSFDSYYVQPNTDSL